MGTQEQDWQQHIQYLESLVSSPSRPKSQGKKLDGESQLAKGVEDLHCLLASVTDIAPVPAGKPQQKAVCPPEESAPDPDDEGYYSDESDPGEGEVPEWAKPENLRAALQRQQGTDPDRIFVNSDRTCDLSQMFQVNKHNFKVRGDSAWWGADGLTQTEEVNYKKAVGLA
jgi:hypothetical protein